MIYVESVTYSEGVWVLDTGSTVTIMFFGALVLFRRQKGH